ncbi:MAG: glycosyltransferase [Paludibacteraceae bacterium]|nr:glycosyltransferase [Paludibacteraceae bacterium]
MVSFIICTYNRCEYIYKTLQKVAETSCDTNAYEIVVVNNNSTDNTELECTRFQKDYPNVGFNYIIEKNQGLSFARNRGMKESVGELLVFLDDDAYVEKDYLQNLLHHMDSHPDAMAFGGKITPLFEEGTEPQWLSKWTRSWVSAIDLGAKIKLFKKKQYPIGANMGFRRECITECGEFDTKLGRSGKNMMGGEEKDFFFRIKAQNYNIYYFPDVAVQHIIPQHRTTKEYIRRYATGIGISENIRTKEKSFLCYTSRIIEEAIKWCATLILWIQFLLCGEKTKGDALVLFRWHVTKNLLLRGNI